MLDCIFNELLGIAYQFVDDPLSAHLCYSEHEARIQIKPFGLLEEKGIRELKEELVFEPWKQSWACFKTGGTVPYDLFSIAFYLMSRYEEYLDFYLDDHQRFTARESVLAQEDLLEQPLINQWALILKEELLSHFPELDFKPRSFEYISTIDIDQAFKYRNKGLKRNLAGFVRDALESKWENFRERWPVIFGLRPDPFNNFHWQESIHNQHQTAVKYFVLLADLGSYDKNVHWGNKAFQKLIQSLTKRPLNQLGIHPSYAASLAIYQEDESVLKKEIKRLNYINKGKTQLSRQHFLMHQFPSTYDAIYKHGIREEHSMGYSTHLGFRAGIAAPFYYYDFQKECKTDLVLYPFCFMDITPLHYLELSPSEAVNKMKELMQTVADVGGLFVSLWHNESLGETERWKNWRILYEEMLAQANEY